MRYNATGLKLHHALLLIGIEERTGELIMESGNNIGTILCHQGMILQAFSPYSRAIGDLLVEDGLITEAELLETLRLQKMNAYMPLGALLLKTGKVTFEVIEMMVQEQIKQAIKEFQSWDGVALAFSDKNITPYDHIRMTARDFIPAEILNAAKSFLSLSAQSQSLPPAPSEVRKPSA